jgi:hypothetical protein
MGILRDCTGRAEVVVVAVVMHGVDLAPHLEHDLQRRLVENRVQELSDGA